MRHVKDRSLLLVLVAACCLLAAGATTARAEELVGDRTYSAGSRLEFSRFGVSFTLPQGWAGRSAQKGSQLSILLGSDTVEGMGVIGFQSGQTAEQIAASLDKTQNLGSGVVLRPAATPVVQGSRVAARYLDETHVGRILVLVGPAQNSVVYVFAGPQKHEALYVQLLVALGTSTSFGAGPAEAARPAAPDVARGPADGGLDQAWTTQLAGKMLHYFSSYNSGAGGGGMASHRVLHLCSNGRFSFGGESSVTMNVPGATGSSAGRSGMQGQWRVEPASESNTVLVLAADDGREIRWNMRFDGSKTFINGQRWLQAPSDRCR